MCTSILKQGKAALLLMSIVGAGISSSATADLPISTAPLYLGSAIAPNIMFVLDDSGSMLRGYMPDGLGINCPRQIVALPSTKDKDGYYTDPYGYWTGYVNPATYYTVRFPTYGYGKVTVCSAVNSGTSATSDAYKDRMSSAVNKIYYNPSIKYVPPLKSDGSAYPDMSFTAALFNGFDSSSSKINLSNNYLVVSSENELYPSVLQVKYSSLQSTIKTTTDFNKVVKYLNDASWCSWSNSGSAWNCYIYDTNITSDGIYFDPEPNVYYYNYDSTVSGCNVTPASTNDKCYKAGSLSTAEEKKNFANWFSYYRTRTLMAKTGVHRAFAVLNGAQRVGYGTINSTSSKNTIDGVKTKTVLRGVRDFTGTNRSDFFDWLAAVQSSGSTPSRRALDDVGVYYQREDSKGPWSDKPGVGGTSSAMQSCRQSYTILTSDGYWNSSGAAVSDARLNQDNMDGTAITGPGGQNYRYIAKAPFSDDWTGDATDVNSGTLADIAMYYWKRDLAPSIDNRVPTNVLDPAFWQHMVVFGVGMGVEGKINSDTAFAAIASGSTVNWPDPTNTEDADRIDDLLHAGVNSRGGFFSAQDPKEFADALTSTLRSIQSRTSSAAALTTNTTKLESGSRVYQARFNSEDWTGQLLAYNIDTTGMLSSVVWDAAEEVPAAASRKIYTWNGTAGVEFIWANLTTSQKDELKKDKLGVVGSDADGQLRLNWIRGDQSNEESNGGTLRTRSKILGDIVSSDPQYAGNTDYGFDKLGTTAGDAYAAYLTAKKAGKQVIYVQANDGMLHAIDADNGRELFAYLPSYFMRSDVNSKIRYLTQPDYQHRYYLNGQIFVGDAYINGTWRSILIGTAGEGGRLAYALDVTNPSSFTSSNVLWEFTDSSDADMGYVLGQATLAYLKNGKWSVVFGNGYNSTNGESVLMSLELDNGSGKIANVKKVNTGAKTNNGLSTTVLLADDHRNIIAAYGGDMLGNMWKFDLTGTNPDSTFKNTGKPAPLFIAKDGNGNLQSITAAPNVRKHPTGGYLLVFGTGQYFMQGDNAYNNVTSYQSLYGIRDDLSTRITYTSNRSEVLQKQEILSEEAAGDWNVRVTTKNTVDWSSKRGWYLDLLTPGNPPVNEGERVVEQALLRYDRAIFTTMKTSGDDCSFGGESWIMEIDALTGSRLSYPALDLNNDSLFDEGDMVTITNADGTQEVVPVSGIKATQGILSEPNVVLGPVATLEYKMASGSSGNIQIIREKGFDSSDSTSRTSWRQLEQ